jgi:hypothetical protein
VVSQGWLHHGWRRSFKASHLSWTTCPELQHLAVVKVHGVFPSNHGYSASSPRLQFHRIPRRDSAQVVTPFVQVGTSRQSSVSGGADYPFTLAKPCQGPASHRIHRLCVPLAGSTRSAMSRSRLWTCFVNDQSLRGQRDTSSRACVTRLPTGLPFRCHDVLEASHTRRASPLLAGLFVGITSNTGNST